MTGYHHGRCERRRNTYRPRCSNIRDDISTRHVTANGVWRRISDGGAAGGLQTRRRCIADTLALARNGNNKDSHRPRLRSGDRGPAKAYVLERGRAVQLYPRPIKESMRKLEALIEYLTAYYRQRDGVHSFKATKTEGVQKSKFLDEENVSESALGVSLGVQLYDGVVTDDPYM